MTALGGVTAIAVAKSLFGGLGCNCFNPALVGRAFLQAAFPTAMTTWPIVDSSRFTSIPGSSLAWPLCQPVYDGLSGATALSQWKFDQTTTSNVDLFLGAVPGSIGETSALLILLGGVYLSVRGMMNWRITAAIIATVAVLSGWLNWYDPTRYADLGFMLFSGGLMLGAVFMATDMVASPMTHKGCWLYGAIIGILVVMIRVWGGMPEGVMYAILLGNAVSPHIDHWIQPQVYGTGVRGQAKLPPRQVIAAGVSSNAGQVAAAPVSEGKSTVQPASDGSTSSGKPSESRSGSRPIASPAAATSSPSQMVGVLVGLGVFCGLAIVSAYLGTQSVILRNQIDLRQEAVFHVLPGATGTRAFRLKDDGTFEAVPLESQGPDVVYAGYNQEQQLVGIAMIGQSPGYQDVVQLTFGYSFESQTILGFRVLASRETPGLGDRVESDEGFLRNFDRLDVRLAIDQQSLANPIEFVKQGQKTDDWQIDGISGATITSRTVTKILSEGTAYWVPKLWNRREDFVSQPRVEE